MCVCECVCVRVRVRVWDVIRAKTTHTQQIFRRAGKNYTHDVLHAYTLHDMHVDTTLWDVIFDISRL